MNPFNILLVEDNPGDVLLTQEAFRHAVTKPVKIHVAKDGQEGIEFLTKVGSHQTAQTPSLVLLDLNLPFKNGMEVLEEIRKNERTKHIPVIILSTSTNQREVKRSYELGANSYLAKPIDFNDFVQMVKRLEHYWIDRSILPQDSPYDSASYVN